MSVPAAPRGATALAPHRPDRGELVHWRVDAPGPWFDLILSVGHDGVGWRPPVAVPPHVRLATWPQPLITPDPDELERIAWTVLAAAKWLRAVRPAAPEADQPTLFDPQPEERV